MHSRLPYFASLRRVAEVGEGVDPFLPLFEVGSTDERNALPLPLYLADVEADGPATAVDTVLGALDLVDLDATVPVDPDVPNLARLVEGTTTSGSLVRLLEDLPLLLLPAAAAAAVAVLSPFLETEATVISLLESELESESDCPLMS
jgi:hypothetical protein